MAKELGYAGAAALLAKDIDASVYDAAEEGSVIAATLHIRAPRGGAHFNYFGQRRSAPGEQPAIEFGDLLNAIEAGPERLGRARYEIVVNRASLEGPLLDELVAERPMGAMTIARLKAKYAR